MNTHLWGWMKICMEFGVTSRTVSGFLSNIHHVCNSQTVLLCLEYSKRVYQGVRVKHTVKDLLAEKRSRQTNGPRYSVSTNCSAFVPYCLFPLYFSPQPNIAATVDIRLGWRGKVGEYNQEVAFKNVLSLFTFWLVLWTNNPWFIH